MKLKIQKNDFISALTPLVAISKGEGVLINCDTSCEITAYDLEKGITTTVQADVIEKGSCVISGTGLLQIAKSMPTDITIETGTKAKIESCLTSFEVNISPSESFPRIPKLHSDNAAAIPQHVFRSLVKKTIFAASQQDQRPVFTGIYFKASDGEISAVGCDGQRLAIARTNTQAEFNFIVPVKTLAEVVKTVKDTEDDMTIAATDKHVIFKVGEYTYFSRLINGEYVAYERLLPNKSETEVIIETDLFKSAVERASIITDKFQTFVKLDFTDDKLKLSSASGTGKVKEEIPIALIGDNVTIGFNCTYLLDALKAITDEKIRLTLNGALAGITINPVETNDFIYLIMPVRMTK